MAHLDTLTDIVTRATERFRDTGNSIITDNEWQDYANEVYRRILGFADWPFLETESTITVTGGTNSAALPSNAHTVLVVYDADNESFLRPEGYPGHGWNIADASDTDPPELYRQTGTDLFVFPKPSSNTDLDVTYVVAPSDMSGGTTPVIPPEWRYLILEGMLAQAYEDDADLDRMAKHEERFLSGLENMLDVLVGRSAPESQEE